MLHTAYNKRPAARGKVRETTKSIPPFIEWSQPKNFVLGFIMSLFGTVALVGLAFCEWVRIDGEALGSAEYTSLRLFDLIVAPLATRESLSYAVAGTLGSTPLDLEYADWFAGFSLMFVVVAMFFALSVVLSTVAMLVSIKPQARTKLAYTGYGIGFVSSFGFIIAAIFANRHIDSPALELSMFPYLTILASVLAMIYCVRFPVQTDDTKKRSPLLTRMVTNFAPVKGDGVREGVRKVILTTALSCFVFFGTTLGIDLFNEWRAAQQRAEAQELSTRILNLEELRHSDFDRIRDLQPRYHLENFRQNNDTVGFIRVGDTRIQYPIVQGEDNDFYLNHDFHGNSSRGGWPCAHYRNRFNGQEISGNTVLLGHNIQTGAYFSHLSRYFRTTRDGSLSFYREHPFVQFNTLFEQMEWKIFAVVLYNTQPELGYVSRYWDTLEFADENEFNDFIIDIMDRSILHTDTDFKYGDNILTLSTCYFPIGQGRSTADTRLAVFARRLRPGETRDDFDTSTARFNNRSFFGDFRVAANVYGSGERGIWDRQRLLLSYNGD
jgi:sortase B